MHINKSKRTSDKLQTLAPERVNVQSTLILFSIPDNCPSRVGPRSELDVAQESMSLSCSVSDKCCTKQRSDHYRRHRGHPKLSSWTEVLTQEGTIEQKRVEQNPEERISRRRGREERRQRYAIMMGSSVCPLDERNSSTQENQQQERMREIEECWLQVEKMAIREEKRVLLYPVYQSKGSAELKKLLEYYWKRVSGDMFSWRIVLKP